MGFSTSARSRLAAGIAVASLVVAACGSSTATPTAAPATTGPTTAPVTAAPVATPIVGDVLNVGEQSTPDGLNPVSIQGNSDFTALAYDTLTYMTSDGKIEPLLAESWKMSNGNKQWDFTIRSGVKFSDGSALDAAAVKGSLEFGRDGGGAKASFLKGFTFEVAGSVVTMKLETPNPMVPAIMSQNYGIGSAICPAYIADTKLLDASHVSCGAGPYVFDPAQTVANDHYTYTANPNYWDKTRQHFKKIVLKIMSAEQSAINAAKTGQIDVFKGDYAEVDAAKAAGLQVVGVSAIWLGLNILDRNGEISKLGDIRLRQALNYAIDRQALADALKTGGGPAYQICVKGSDCYSESLNSKYAYDPAKAKALMAEAGVADGFEITVVTMTPAGFATVAEAIAGQLEKVGIKVKLTVEKDGPSWVGATASKKFAGVVGGQQAGPMFIVSKNYITADSGPFNAFGSTTPELAALFEQEAAAADDAARAAIDLKIGEYLIENAWFVPVSWSAIEYFAIEKIAGLAATGGNPTPNIGDFYFTK